MAVIFAVGYRPVLGAEPLEYDARIKPMLRDRCVTCHGQLRQKAGLRLDAGSLVRKGSKKGPIIIAGNSDKSELIQRITATDESKRMPPEGKPLSAAQIDAL
ncbi:MAG TPA: c-type cytochrome domain-containing protein, partial [Humisphaera sp.]|nr:c-type cytochrome domain-containing protein [Humisphaera sp.]